MGVLGKQGILTEFGSDIRCFFKRGDEHNTPSVGNDVLIVCFDGSCPGVQNIADRVIGATSQQYPLLKASLGVEVLKT